MFIIIDVDDYLQDSSFVPSRDVNFSETVTTQSMGSHVPMAMVTTTITPPPPSPHRRPPSEPSSPHEDEPPSYMAAIKSNSFQTSPTREVKMTNSVTIIESPSPPPPPPPPPRDSDPEDATEEVESVDENTRHTEGGEVNYLGRFIILKLLWFMPR